MAASRPLDGAGRYVGLSSEEIRASLIKDHHVCVRDCDSFEGLASGQYLSIAVRSAGENDHLVRAVSQVLKRK